MRIEVDYEPGKASISGYNKQSEVSVTGPFSRVGISMSYSIQIRWYVDSPDNYIPFRTVKTSSTTSMGPKLPASPMLTLRAQVRQAQPVTPDGPHVRNVKRTNDMLAVHDLPGPSSKIISLNDTKIYPIRFVAIFSIGLYEKLPANATRYAAADFSPKRADVGTLLANSEVDYYIELEKLGLNGDFNSKFELIRPSAKTYNGWLPK